MEKITAFIKPMPQKKKASSERGELIGRITDTLNGERRGGKFPKLTYKRIGMKLAHLKVTDLYYIESMFRDCKNRGYPCGKFFWGSLKPRPEDAVQ